MTLEIKPLANFPTVYTVTIDGKKHPHSFVLRGSAELTPANVSAILHCVASELAEVRQ